MRGALAKIVAGAAVLVCVGGCPLPYQYNAAGSLAAGDADSDPATPSITATPYLEYEEIRPTAGAPASGRWESGLSWLENGGATTQSDTTVEILTESAGATIYYTLDDSRPDPRVDTTRVYDVNEPHLHRIPDPTVDNCVLDCHYRAVAIGPSMKPSAEMDVRFAVHYPQAAAPVFSPEGGVFVSDQVVTLTSATADARIYYTISTDGSTPTAPVPGASGTTRYDGPILATGPDHTTSIAAVAIADQLLDSTVSRAAYTVDYEGLADPTFNPPGGAYSATQVVTISSSAGATISYTTDGSTPVPGTSPQFITSGQLTVDESMTLRAIATMDQMDPSEVVTAAYTLAPAQPSVSPASGTYYEEKLVSMSSSTTGAEIHYTVVDGIGPAATPEPGQPGTWLMDGSGADIDRRTVGRGEQKAYAVVAYVDGWELSPVTSRSYTVGPEEPTIQYIDGFDYDGLHITDEKPSFTISSGSGGFSRFRARFDQGPSTGEDPLPGEYESTGDPWSFTTEDPLDIGPHTLFVRQQNAAGIWSDAAAIDFVVAIWVTTNSTEAAANGQVSIREAIVAANTNADYLDAPAGRADVPDVIAFSSTSYHCLGTYGPLPTIESDMLIIGDPNNAGTVKLCGDWAVRQMEITDGTVQIAWISFTFGRIAGGVGSSGGIFQSGSGGAAGLGGALYVNGEGANVNLTLDNVRFIDCGAEGGTGGTGGPIGADLVPPGLAGAGPDGGSAGAAYGGDGGSGGFGSGGGSGGAHNDELENPGDGGPGGFGGGGGGAGTGVDVDGASATGGAGGIYGGAGGSTTGPHEAAGGGGGAALGGCLFAYKPTSITLINVTYDEVCFVTCGDGGPSQSDGEPGDPGEAHGRGAFVYEPGSYTGPDPDGDLIVVVP